MNNKQREQIPEKKVFEEAIVPEYEQPYEIPSNWAWTKVGRLSTIIRGVSYKKHQVTNYLSDEDAFIIRGGNVQDGHLVNKADNVYVSRELVKEEQFVKQGDVVIVSSTGSSKVIGKPALITKTEPAISFGAFLTMLRPNQAVDPNYFGLFFLSHLYKERIVSLAKGSNINNIKKDHLEGLNIPLPNISEQTRIAQKVERLFRKIEEANRLIDQVEKTFDFRRAALLDKAFQGKLTREWRQEYLAVGTTDDWIEEINLLGKGEQTKKKKEAVFADLSDVPFDIPVGWKWIKFQDLVKEMKLGLVKSSKEQSSQAQHLYLKMNNITNRGELDLIKTTRVDLEEDKLDGFKLEEGDFLFNTRNSSELVGKSAIYDIKSEEPVLFNNNILRIRFHHGINSRLINYYFNSFTGKAMLNTLKSSTTNVAAIYAKNLNKMIIPIPPQEEQGKIVGIIDRIVEHEKQVSMCTYQQQNLDALKQSILNKAFRGELGTTSE
ncbi:restriction endonuclease subunit S [Salipaludibacillus sp. HK11]|uniref:restriction endonuclease subunit S n=1 Tax=Salipaludibacillus sp. HK11 TaxID=3394320 RepID=UPI0039FC08B8